MSSINTEISVPVDYISVGVINRRWIFPYSDLYFRQSSETYNHSLARVSLGLAVAADRNSAFPLEKQNSGLVKYFKATGFSDVRFHLYDCEPNPDTVACALARKQIDDFTLIAVTVCGNGYGREWEGNITVGNGERHLGFSQGCESVKMYLENYLKEFDIRSKVKLWFAGYSRASAVLNLAGYDIVRKNPSFELYAYLFATPSVMTDASELCGMFNITAENDPFANLPLKSWKMGKNGTVKYFRSADMKNTEQVAKRLGCDNYMENSYVDSMFDYIFSALDTLFPTSDDYCRYFQPVLISLYRDFSFKNIFKNIRILNIEKKHFSPLQKKTYRKLKHYIVRRIVCFGRDVKMMNQQGVWKKEQRLDTNILKEHSGDMYVIRMFSSDTL